MARIPYTPRVWLATKTRRYIDTINALIEEYSDLGTAFTDRFYHYKALRHPWHLNTRAHYVRLTRACVAGRESGLIDWDDVVDEGRAVERAAHWDSPADILAACADQYREDRWLTQPVHVELWVEKDTQFSTFRPVCRDLDVPLLSCHGANSVTACHLATQRFRVSIEAGQTVVVFYFGDHDPTGLMIPAAIEETLGRYCGYYGFADRVSLRRLGVTLEQVKTYALAPNLVNPEDSRSPAYQAKYGNESWEMEALDPRVMIELVRSEVTALQHKRRWRQAERREARGQRALESLADRYDEVIAQLTNGKRRSR